MDYINEICPVCRKSFNKDDDIVVCPECGTPHHRECWQQNGACSNAALHNEGFEWHPLKAEPPAPAVNPPAAAPADENAGNPIPVIPSLTRVEDESDFENLILRSTGFKKDDTIDGIKAGDACLYIQQGAKRYLNKFKNKKITFNWGAFFFSSAWFFYRKLYKAGFIFLSLFVALSLFSYPLIEKIDTQVETIQSEMSQIAGDSGSVSSSEIMEHPELMQQAKNLMKYYAVYFSMNMLGPGLLSALLADYLYKKKMKKDIQAAVEEAKNEGTQYEKALIMQKGGTSFLWGGIVLFASSYIPEALLYIGKYISNIF